MKEKYVAPAILFESFALSQTIARNCGDKHQGTLGESNHYNESTCAWIVGGVEIFFDSTPCADWEDYFWEGDTPENYPNGIDIEGACYNNPSGGQEIFSST